MRCKCGNNKFYATQKIYVDIVVNEHGNFIENTNDTTDASIIEGENPYGPFICTKCLASYEDDKFFKELPKTCGDCVNFELYKDENDGYGGCDACGYTKHKNDVAGDCEDFREGIS